MQLKRLEFYNQSPRLQTAVAIYISRLHFNALIPFCYSLLKGCAVKHLPQTLALLIIFAVSALAGTQYRGVNVSLAGVGEDEIEMLATEWKGNLVRIRLGTHDQCDYSIVEIHDPANSNHPTLLALDRLIKACDRYDVRVVIDIHQFPGYSHYDESPKDYRLWDDVALQERFVRYWRGIAERYSDWGDVIYGYDLLNEPSEMAIQVWLDLAARTARAIRQVDTDHAIVIEPRGGMSRMFAEFSPIDVPNVIYSAHLWEPHEVSLQGVLGNPSGVEYPSADWNKRYLRDVLRPTIEFQERYDVPILIGEFGATTYVPPDSRAAYLEDVLALFEEYGFDYAFSQYREFSAFSPEHVAYRASWGEIAKYVGVSDALAVLKAYFSRNVQTIQAAESTKPTCLFDQSHWENGLDTNVLSLDYAWRLAAVADVVFHVSGEITPDVLAGVDLLVTGNSQGTPYRPSEISAMASFVESGGSLLCYQGVVYEPSINAFLGHFGIRHDPAVVFSETPAWEGDEGDSYWVETFNSGHPVACSSCSFHIAWGGSLSISPPAVAFAASEPETWKDANRNGHHDAGEEQGPFTVIATSEFGEGRVVVVADETLLQVCNWSVLRQLVNWLLSGQTQ